MRTDVLFWVLLWLWVALCVWALVYIGGRDE